MDRPLIEPRTLRGFADLPPTPALHRRRLLRVAEDTFASFGYDPIQTPALEHADVLKGKGGSESDKQMFEFDDQGGRPVALRFDLTVPLARFAAQHTELRPPLRLYQVGYVWRGERPQRGRYREFFQCDADVIGETGPGGDAEIVAMFTRALSRMDIGPFLMRVNDRRVLNGLLADLGLLDRAVPVLRGLDKIEKVGPDAVRDELAGAGVAGVAADRVLALAGARGGTDEQTFAAVTDLLAPDGEGRAALDQLRLVLDLARAAGAPPDALRVDPGIARGLDYYTGLVFETTLLSAPEVGSICSGGRYDDLAGLFTRQRLPGVGGSIGLSRLLAALEGGDALPGAGPGPAARRGDARRRRRPARPARGRRPGAVHRRARRRGLPGAGQARDADEVRGRPGRALRAHPGPGRERVGEGPADRRAHVGRAGRPWPTCWPRRSTPSRPEPRSSCCPQDTKSHRSAACQPDTWSSASGWARRCSSSDRAGCPVSRGTVSLTSAASPAAMARYVVTHASTCQRGAP